MGYDKESILKMEKSYSVNLAEGPDGMDLLIGCEIEGPNYILKGPRHNPQVITDKPGGTMVIQPVPNQSGQFVSIMQMYPPFRAKNAGVYYHEPKSAGSGWQTKRLFGLPFAHRLEVVTVDAEAWLLVATVAEDKADPSDWTKPGKVYAGRLSKGLELEDMEIVMESLTRNHGMVPYGSGIMVSGAEGIYEIRADEGDEVNWTSIQVFEREVSEMVSVDLDGDGQEELVTIEPFHGDKLRIYQREKKKWNLIFEDRLSFGHGLWAGQFNGQGTVVVGNRADDCNLVSYTLTDPCAKVFTREVVEERTGTTQTAVYEVGCESVLVASNPLKGEVARYLRRMASA